MYMSWIKYLMGSSIDILTDVLVNVSAPTQLTLDQYIGRLSTKSWLTAHQYTEHPLMSADTSVIIRGLSVNYQSIIGQLLVVYWLTVGPLSVYSWMRIDHKPTDTDYQSVNIHQCINNMTANY